MKRMKRNLAVIAALVLIVVSVLPAFAADSDPTYKYYKIINGTQASGSAELAVSGWGNGVNGPDLLTALKASNEFGTPNSFATCSNAVNVAKVLSGWEDNSDSAMAFAKIAYKNIRTANAMSTPSTAGYYLVVDDTATVGKDKVKNLSILMLTGKASDSVVRKVSKPTVEKKVKDIDTSASSVVTTDWQDSADWEIGKAIPFKLEATLPEDLNIAAFPEYKLVFHDTESAGLTFDPTSVYK